MPVCRSVHLSDASVRSVCPIHPSLRPSIHPSICWLGHIILGGTKVVRACEVTGGGVYTGGGMADCPDLSLSQDVGK